MRISIRYSYGIILIGNLFHFIFLHSIDRSLYSVQNLLKLFLSFYLSFITDIFYYINSKASIFRVNILNSYTEKSIKKYIARFFILVIFFYGYE